MTATDIPMLRERLRESRQKAIEAFREHERPDTLLHELRRITDNVLRDLVKQCPLPAGATLAAVGGYGRGELYPYSDVDLLILLPHPPAAADEEAIGQLVAALWDLGMEPGHSVRTIEDCEREAQADITVETALLESRWLAGSRPLMKRFDAAMHARLDPAVFFRAKRIEMQQRHARYQDTPYALEPNCKESPGGLRDLQVILWMARAAGFGESWREVAKAGLLTESEARDLRKAEQAFKRLRIELHLLAKRREDRVLFDLQPALSEVYGIKANATRRASELLMQRYYWAARLVTQLNTILVQNIEERLFPRPAEDAQPIDDDFRSLHGRLDIILDDAFERNPTLLLRAFLTMQQHQQLKGMSARTLRAIWHARDRIDAQFRRNPVNRKLFLQILQQPAGIVHELRRMTMLNILPRYLPVFRRIVGQMQHDLFHVYTVDQHTLQVIRNLRRFTMPEHAQEYPLATQLIAELDNNWLLYVAALFHDIAKGRGGDHSELGAREVRRFAHDHGLAPADAELVEFLVRQHLLMSTVAQKRDLSDPDVVRDFAAAVGDERHLTALYLLTVADIRGTSPKVWNAWKGKLLEDLYRLTLRALGGGQADAHTVLNDRKAEAARLTRLAGLRDDAREAFWKQLDVAYFLRHDASDIAWHTRHLYHRPAPADAVVKARPTEQGEGLQVMVYTRDVPELFMVICGFFDARSLSIQDARIHTTRHGYALDSFIVLLPDGQQDLRAQATLVEHELAERLRDARAAAQAPLTQGAVYGRARLSRMSRMFPVPPQVELQPDERSKSWRLQVTATDRSGLLHALARVFARHAVNLQMAKVMTLGDRVEDVFILEGTALERPRTQMQFEKDVQEALAGENTQKAAA
ncbi:MULTISPECIES: [protein-PII] uridylyltransferase [unclassified Achromobacter]|uniref:[protein-PII] uridylyltransferase n=1 Tax=unclassified Achromobacter TaxID=2626865 RepID=UPI000B51E50B|nr:MULTISPECIES: [protein-PII] uridylyltransferase [unclassified Achromobacter]OWT79995.1 [protein-PII] uridylyltransferase [Achromobacter sp. HZ34]OWT81879.1 [protein-PII] uridylyltransferase [Achromobacter sp. HZ28]